MMLTVLVFTIAIMSAIQHDKSNRYACAVYSAPMLLMFLFGDYIDSGIWYYRTCAGLSLMTLLILLKFFETKLSHALAFTCAIAVLLNYFGWSWYEIGKNPDPYNWLFLMYYTWVAFIMFKDSLIWKFLSEGYFHTQHSS